jgi:hypothetical protein
VSLQTNEDESPRGKAAVIHIAWAKAKNGWLPLSLPSPSAIRTVGVYIIWLEGNPSHVVRVGSGNIGECLCCDQNDAEIQAYARHGTLRVTWAAVPASQLQGVQRYLSEYWRPLVEDRYPKVPPIAVNSPFAA